MPTSIFDFDALRKPSHARRCCASATSCWTSSSMARCRGFRRKRRRRSSRPSAAKPISAAPATSRAISPRSARAASSSACRRGRCGRAARRRHWRRESRHRKRAGVRSGAADHAQSALRLRAFLHAYAARGLGAGGACLRRHRAEADRRHPAAAGARRHRAAVRLRQGRADRARDPQRHRRRAQSSASA